ncbi:MAG: 30S ribosome-binding factor RbfA [Actinobacteria bacterium]|nr:30S ribosome-binding factor RbfA [Actinomycetota bacterium]
MDRIRKIEIDLKREISYIINAKVKNPKVSFVTITDVRLSPDFHWLDIFVSIMGNQDAINEGMRGLKESIGFIKKNLRERVKLRIMPKINFLYDTSVDKGIRIAEILEDLSRKK